MIVALKSEIFGIQAEVKPTLLEVIHEFLADIVNSESVSVVDGRVIFDINHWSWDRAIAAIEVLEKIISVSVNQSLVIKVPADNGPVAAVVLLELRVKLGDVLEVVYMDSIHFLIKSHIVAEGTVACTVVIA